MKQFIICPNCGAIELKEVYSTGFEFYYKGFPKCSKCNYSLIKWGIFSAKAISIKQPYSYLICSGIKDIENRTWKTNFRGRVLIHAGASSTKFFELSRKLLDWQRRNYQQWAYGCMDSPKSAIIGSVEIVDCVINHGSVWAEKTPDYLLSDVLEDISLLGIENHTKPIYNWVLSNPILFEKPIPCKGKLSFFIPEIA